MQSVKPNECSAFLFYMPRKDFITFIMDNEWQIFYPKLLSDIFGILRDRKEEAEYENIE